jgi:hypothetical protein
MIDALDKMIRRLLLDGVAQLTDPLQVRFEAPDQDWLDYLSDLSPAGSPVLGVDCYLVELRENTMLRSNEWLQTEQNGSVFREPAPMRVDLHYLVSAWDSATISETLEPGLEEHKLLYAVLAVLAAATPLNAGRIYPPGSAELGTVPGPIQDFDLPTRLVPPEGYAKLAEFWTSMGSTVRWRPAAHLVVTLPVLLEHELVGEPVTTELVGYGIDGGPVVDTRITVGVEALHGGAAVPGAWVRLETTAGDAVAEGRADSSGHIVFEVTPGSYLLQARATGLDTPLPTPIEIPSSNGGYRVSFP